MNEALELLQEAIDLFESRGEFILGGTPEHRWLDRVRAVLDMDQPPTSACPRCGAEQPDYDGFGVVYCPACGFCQHPAYTGDVCDLCGQMT